MIPEMVNVDITNWKITMLNETIHDFYGSFQSLYYSMGVFDRDISNGLCLDGWVSADRISRRTNPSTDYGHIFGSVPMHTNIYVYTCNICIYVYAYNVHD